MSSVPPVRSLVPARDPVSATGVIPASLALPPLSTLPGHPEPDALADFVRRRARGWGSVPVPLSPAVTAALWVLAVLNLVFGAWLWAVRAGTAACSGTLCAVATLSDHAGLTLVLAGLCGAAVLVLAPVTRGLTRAGGGQIAVAVVAGLCGVAALAGVVALLLFAAACVAVTFGIFVVVVDRL